MSIFSERKQGGQWDQTTPIAWRYEYTVTDPTNLMPRFLRSFEIRSERSLLAIPCSLTIARPVHPHM